MATTLTLSLMPSFIICDVKTSDFQTVKVKVCFLIMYIHAHITVIKSQRTTELSCGAADSRDKT